MRLRAAWPVTALVAVLSAACATTSPPAESPAAVTATTVAMAASAPSSTAAAATPGLATPAAEGVDPVAFLRARQPACAAHAASTGNPAVEPDRFVGATGVRGLGDGAFLVRDGRGTQLVVEPAKGVVLPPSGSSGDVVPVPYGAGCPERVFVGASAG